MRVLLSTYDSRGGVEPLLGLAVRLRELGAEVRMCAPPDCAERLAEVGVPLVPVGQPVRALVHGAEPPSMDDVPRRIAELVEAWFGKVTDAARGCDALVASGLMPAAAAARSIAEKLGIYSVHVSYCPIFLPSPHHQAHPLPGRPLPPDVTDNQTLWELNAEDYKTVYGPALNAHRVANGLPPVDDVRGHILGEHPWLAADPILAPWQEPAELDVVRTGAWFVRDDRPLPADLMAFLDAGTPPVYVGFGSMRAPEDMARAAIEAIRAQGRRAIVAKGWAGLAPIDDRDDCFAVGEVNQQELFGRVAAVMHHGGAGTTTTATLAGASQVVVPQWADQPYFAGRVADLGIGAAHGVQAPTTESLSTALSIALTADVRARAAEVAGMTRIDGAMVAAKLLLDAAGAERLGSPVRAAQSI
ncbi:MAG: glycosyltransferase [Nocardiopsaceae bacterium]|jgi:vancomycin aglycone glucosyltransferase|nr:glycosyltransferase [Nocardiopsaceae bacterium]